jgi:nucleoside-triphosphatase THEP1
MQTDKQIYIFSRAIRTGKTTQLQNQVTGRNDVAGILTPDDNGMRKLLDIASGRRYDLQVQDDFAGPVVRIGRFAFDLSVMETARQLLWNAAHTNVNWLIIDEAGKLETEQDAGLEPALAQVIDHYRSGKAKGKLLLVIRDSLLEKAIDKYGLENAIVLHDHLPETL